MPTDRDEFDLDIRISPPSEDHEANAYTWDTCAGTCPCGPTDSCGTGNTCWDSCDGTCFCIPPTTWC
jgi:hypothetical protein